MGCADRPGTWNYNTAQPILSNQCRGIVWEVVSKASGSSRRMINAIWSESGAVSVSLVISIRTVTVMWWALNPDRSGPIIRHIVLEHLHLFGKTK